MAKAKSKKAKKAVVKKAKRKTARPGRKRPVKVKPAKLNPNRGLFVKVLEIMAEVPIMPCSLIGKDKQGHDFAYTRAEEVFQVYYQKCIEKGLKITQTGGHTEKGVFIDEWYSSDGTKTQKETACARWIGTYKIQDVATGQTASFVGAGDGDNDIWSLVSAQTIAMKQALLLFFQTAWPQPTDLTKVVKKALAEVPKEHRLAMMEKILPAESWDVLTSTGAVEALRELYK